MTTLQATLISLPALFGAFLLWVAYQIHFRRRLEFIRLGRGNIVESSAMAAPFCRLLLFQAVFCLASSAWFVVRVERHALPFYMLLAAFYIGSKMWRARLARVAATLQGGEAKA